MLLQYGEESIATQGHNARQEGDQFPYWQKDNYCDKRNSNIELRVATTIPGSKMLGSGTA